MLTALAITLTMAMPPSSCSDLRTAEAFRHYGHLLAAAMWGWKEREAAAFLVRTADGRLSARPWGTRASYRASYVGVIPQRCVAIMHTHPGQDVLPSRQDRAEARRINIPVIVVTAAAVTVAYPDGTTAYLAERPDWFRALSR